MAKVFTNLVKEPNLVDENVSRTDLHIQRHTDRHKHIRGKNKSVQTKNTSIYIISPENTHTYKLKQLV